MKLFNQQTKSIVDCNLKPSEIIKVYTCGPTVYDFPHIGNWYTFIRYDLLIRVLRTQGFKVQWVMNITDVGHLVSDADSGEDKMEKGAKREGKTAWDVAKYYGDYFFDTLAKLNFAEINHLPKATDYIGQQIDLVRVLDSKGYTYIIDDGVYFDTSKFIRYPYFASLNLEGQEEGARVEYNEQKRNIGDFALWKFSAPGEKRDMEWDSPWGKGFPGWHLECSAMIHAILGEPIHFHAGGIDHIPVHHTNEIAQSEAAFDNTLSRYWMHCNHIQVEGKKMSKSLGNFYTYEDVLSKGFNSLIFRVQVLNGHYRSQSEFSWESLEAMRNRIQSWVDTLNSTLQKALVNTHEKNLEEFKEELVDALDKDLNSPQCLSLIDEHVKSLPKKQVIEYVNFLNELLGIDLEKYLNEPSSSEQDLISARHEARKSGDWTKSDSIRQELSKYGIKISDQADQQIWSRIV